MITSIDKLENLGIYQDFSTKTCSDFNKYNLIYGWNGSGKSTLSRLFAHIAGQKNFENKKCFKVTITSNGTQYKECNYPLKSENIVVFNEDFIKDNIDWNGTIKSILLLDETNIGDTKRYTFLKDYLYGSNDEDGEIKKVKDKEKSLEKDDSDIQRILTNIGKIVKNHYQVLDTGDTYYLNYNKTKVSSLIEDNVEPLSDSDIMDNKSLELAIKEARPIKKEKIRDINPTYNEQQIVDMIQSIQIVIESKVASKVIEELKVDQQLSEWVRTGLEIHKSKKLKICSFCGNQISETREEDLEAHFSDALNQLNRNIDDLLEKIQLLKYESELECENASVYYEELQDNVLELNVKFNKEVKALNAELERYEKLLHSKKSNPFNILDFDDNNKNLVTIIKEINNLIGDYSKLIKKHNKKTDSFEEATKSVRKKIERHYVQEQIGEQEYKEKIEQYNKKNEEIKKAKKDLKDKEDEYLKLEAKLSSEGLGAEEFNEKLFRFLGYDEITLAFDKNEKGYKILRNSIEEAENLSEGEKTAIAFIYFITKIKESGRKISDCIVVIDDPISSFDSNKLFSSYAYTKSECDEAKQIFILTHNYNYFSLVLGWFNRKHKKNDTGGKVPDYSLYRVENKIVDGKRAAILKDGGESLKQATEYDYVFSTVYHMKDKPLSKQESIFCGNVCRKLVESFLSFKFPKQRADLASLLNVALPGKENDIERERIYKFTNIYSHDKQINVFEELDADILDSNNQMVINDVLSMIKKLDSIHYDAMVDKVKNDC
ncbi:MAG: hypothetical protein EOM34_15630 [Clostridia bacterium]|nr:hypothetical protein [Clostridia bacterium]NCD03879.1 hypothetical protein [Clostridia bacterium]